VDNSRALKDPAREKKLFANRALIAGLIILLSAGALLARLYFLQVIDHATYQTLSDKNRMQLQSVPPTRGLIYDRNGVLLADNQPVFSVTLVKERTEDIAATLAELGKIITLDEDDLERFNQRMEGARKPYESMPVKVRLSEEEIARLAVERYRFPGVEVEAELVRHYPMKEATAHVLGYVARINEKELKTLDPTNYSGTHYLGKLGIEKFYEDLLHGYVGFQNVETNARGRVLRVLERTDPTPGHDLVMHLDSRLQLRVEEALNGRRGAVVAIEPKTGGILALVSTPSFDPNLFVTGIGHQDYKNLRESPDIPLFNRALRGQYPPGSTIKPIMGLAGLDTATITRQTVIWDPGWYQLKNDDRYYRDWKRVGHGRVDLHTAIVQSCDTFFYDLGHKMGVDFMSQYFEQFGVGTNWALDIPEGSGGLLPSREWKKAVKSLPWFPGDSLNLSIGQGFMLMTPLQLATAAAVLANRGVWHRPRLIREIRDENGDDVMIEPGTSPANIQLKNPDDWNFIFQSMSDVMHDGRGTARSSGRDSLYKIAGKTGTAQVVAIKQGEKYDAEALDERHRDHALFIGFAPVDDPQIAVAVLVENGGGGSSAAAPVARAVFDAWLLELSGYFKDKKDNPPADAETTPVSAAAMAN
jgi:penicillin-binding protein 2